MCPSPASCVRACPHSPLVKFHGTSVAHAYAARLPASGKQSAVNNTVYYRGGSFSLLNVKAAYQFVPEAVFEVGTTN
jgi:hypothetical protein